jgi:dolichol-phosphate mannosyltransferase
MPLADLLMAVDPAVKLPKSPRVLVSVATYNELENLPLLVEEVFTVAPHVDLLVIDDNSPDGTGVWAKERAHVDSHVHVIQRAGKLGLGTATIAAMHYAIEHDYDYLLNIHDRLALLPRRGRERLAAQAPAHEQRGEPLCAHRAGPEARRLQRRLPLLPRRHAPQARLQQNP